MAAPLIARRRGVVPSKAVRVIVFANSPYAITADDDQVIVDATDGNVLITLPSVSTLQKAYLCRELFIKKVDVSAHTVTTTAVVGDLIDGAASIVLTTQYENLGIINDVNQSAWWRIVPGGGGGGGTGITALTGDVTASGTGSVVATLANTAVTPASYGDSTHVGAFTVDAKGRLTAASSVAIAFPAAGIGGTIANTQVAFGTGVDVIGGSNDLTWDGATLTLYNGTARASLATEVLAAFPTETFAADTAFVGSTIDLYQTLNLAGFTLDAQLTVNAYALDLTAAGGTLTRGVDVTRSILYIEDGLTTTNLTDTYRVSSASLSLLDHFNGTSNTNATASRASLGLFGGTNPHWMTNYYANWFGALDGDPSGFGQVAAFWAADVSLAGPHPYAFWYDGDNTVTATAGVYRINALGIMAYYNPTFTKYEPGATNFERVRQEWISDVATIGTEAGGTGTLRVLNLVGSDVQANGVSILGGGATGELLAWLAL